MKDQGIPASEIAPWYRIRLSDWTELNLEGSKLKQAWEMYIFSPATHVSSD